MAEPSKTRDFSASAIGIQLIKMVKQHSTDSTGLSWRSQPKKMFNK